MYDWANSVFSLTITTAIFPEYFLGITSNAVNGDKVNFLGFDIVNSVLFSYALSFSFLLAAILSPFLTSIADYTGRKKMFMRTFCYIGSLSCAALYFFKEDTLEIGVFAFILAALGYSGSIVFYNSYLPEIATEDRYDKISARGFSLGYIGSVILLIINLLMLSFPQAFGLPEGATGLAARISFLTVGVWWFLFAQYTFYVLPSNVYNRKPEKNWIYKGFKELKKVLRELKGLRLLKTFLIGFFFYSMGLQTVMYVAPLFAKKVILLESENLIVTILLIQLVAIPGAAFFNFISSRFGNIYALLAGIIVWIAICISAYFVTKGLPFYLLASTIGFVMGGIQSLSRATYAKLIPDNTIDHASYFSFYDVAEKLSIVLGTFAYGLIEALTGTMKNSVIALAIFFIIGLIFIIRIPSKKIYTSSIV
jgi:MFS transporter, UMF1 family